MDRSGGRTRGAARGCLEDLPFGWITVVATLMAVGLSPVGFIAYVALVGGMGDARLDDEDEPAGPPPYALDGAAVTVTPATGLGDASTVTVTGTGLHPEAIVEVLPCALDGDRTVARCDAAQAVRFAASVTGELAVPVVVPRFVTGGGGPAVDCAERAGRCALVAADVGARHLSGGVPLAFRPDLPPAEAARRPPPPVAAAVVDPDFATPEGLYVAGEVVSMTAAGFVPGEPVEVGVCPSETVDEEVLAGCDGQQDEGDFADPTAETAGGEVLAGPDGVAQVDLLVPRRLEPDDDADDGRWCHDPGCVAVVAAVAEPRRRAAVALRVLP